MWGGKAIIFSIFNAWVTDVIFTILVNIYSMAINHL